MRLSYRQIKAVLVLLLGVFLGAVWMFFVLVAQADVDVVRPDANGTTGGTAVGCTSSLHYECINEVITEPTPASTGSDYLQIENIGVNFSQLGTFTDIDTATSVTIWIYNRDGGTNSRATVGLYAADETTVYGGPTTIAYQSGADWSSVTYSGLSLSQADVDAMRLRIGCTKVGGGKSNDCFVYVAYADVSFDPLIEVTVATSGSQVNLSPGDTTAYVGGSFAIIENISSRNVTSITIEENGTVDAANDLSNIELYYEYDTSAPYDCVSESYAGTETQFGSTDTDGFSGANGTSVFTGSIAINTTQAMCVYTILDIDPAAASGQTIEIEIDDPTVDVVLSGSPDIIPNTTVDLSGTTVIQAPSLEQVHYHWRNDDGDETDTGTGATSATGVNDDETLDTLGKQSEIRLRMEVSNQGNATSNSIQYRLEYAQKVSECEFATGWTDVGGAGGDWDMFDTVNLTDGNNTTNIAESSGGVADANVTFLSTNAGVKDTSSQTSGITLTSTEFVELEYSIISTSNASEGDQYCFRLTDAGTELDVYTAYPEATILADVNITTLGTQHATVDIPTSDVYVGAAFVLTDNISGNNTVESITITATGTIDLQNDVNNIEIRYDLDTSLPFDCQGESFDIADTQFGSTDTDGFSANGTSTFTGSQTINPSQTMCVYVVYDIDSDTSNDETLNIRLANASSDISLDSGTVSPSALVALTGTTVFVLDEVRQVHYHWRDDDGNEVGATSATDGNEDTFLENLRRTNPTRLRIGIANEGSSSSPAYQYRLEWALKESVCSLASGWTDVGATDDEFNMFNSANLTDGSDTTNIAEVNGGVTDVGTTYFTNNNSVKDTSSQTASLALPGSNYFDLEYSITASTSATEGATYCFRVTDAGTEIDGYDTYPEVIIKPRTDFFVQRGVTTVSGTSITINAGTEYIAPSASSSAFIRIVGTNNVGAGSPTNSGSADDVTVYISNPWNIQNNITFTRPGTAVDTTRVSWEIIEYVGATGGDNEMVVRQQSALTYVSGNTTVTTPTVPSILDDTDVAVFITGQLNPDTATAYPLGLSTAAWNPGTDDATFTRGASGNTAGVSYAVIEFVGDNWKVQRAINTYASAGTIETQSITAVNSLTRTFLHAQKRVGSGLNSHSDFGHNVYFSGIGQVSFGLETGASTPGSHTSVAWIIENTQVIGDSMIVSRSNGSESSGPSPKIISNSIGVTISDTQDASIFFNNHGDEANGGSQSDTFPEPIIGAEIISVTQYQNWVADPDGDTRSWRTEVVEWPTAARDIAQDYYWFFVDNNALDPTDPWPEGVPDVGETTEVTVNDGPIVNSSTTRLRMGLTVSAASMDSGIDTFKLQYGERNTTCTAVSDNEWFDVGEIGSTTALWRGVNATPADGTSLSTDPPGVGDLNLTLSDTAGTYEEENPTVVTPYDVIPGDTVEFDWLMQNNGAKHKTTYCFRMLEADGLVFDTYNAYPAMRTAGFEPLLSNWRWYDDETNPTPTSPLASENVSPIDIANADLIKLRLTVKEVSGSPGTDIKFALQYSQEADFSTNVLTLTSTTSCSGNSLWCYADGAGVDNGQIDSSVISDANTCTGGSGDGCGTYNEGATTTGATFDQPAFSSTEYEFTLRHDGARANAVYYFRLYDLTNDEPVSLDSGSSYPSLSTQGAQLVFTVSGVDAEVSIAGQTTDATTTANSIGFGSISTENSTEAAQQLTVDTNATEGYQLLMYATQQLTSQFGDTIPAITSSNASPAGWNTACTGIATGCFGYHTTDATLAGPSSRFSPIDSYAAFSTAAEEIMYSSIPTVDVQNVLFRVSASINQSVGDYTADVVYIVVPVF